MDGEVLVRVLDRVAGGDHQIHAVTQAGVVLAAPLIDRVARRVLERHVGRAIGVDAAVDQAREARMIEVREDVALGVQDGGEPGIARIGGQDVQGHSRVRAAGADPLEDDAGRLAQHLPNQAIGGELAARLRFGRAVEARRRCRRRPRRRPPRPRTGRSDAGRCASASRLIDEPRVVIVGVQQRQHFGPHVLVVCRGADPGLALLGRQPARRFEQFVDLAPGRAFHGQRGRLATLLWILLCHAMA